MKRIVAALLILALVSGIALAAPAPPEIIAPSAVLMERDTGRVLYQKDAHTKRPPASVTKIMTLLLVMEALDAGKISMGDMVTVSPHAAGMGGSQVYLEPGEQMSMDDMLKAVVVASGNDAAVALAEHVAGSEEGFVALMNARAKDLAMNDTHFVNCTGLDAEGHLTSAYDIAIMSCALLKHEKIKNYTTIWMDSLRGGAFQLANTNKLIRSYKDITGLKTGFTSTAKYCMAASAEREGMELVAAVMACPSIPDRSASATRLLDYGFANFALYDGAKDVALAPVTVLSGVEDACAAKLGGAAKLLLEKGVVSELAQRVELPENVKAPVAAGQTLGALKIMRGEQELASVPIVAAVSVERQSLSYIFWNLLARCMMK